MHTSPARAQRSGGNNLEFDLFVLLW
eukprot:SAG31_NODE_24161_length_488_cov_0.655527_1_plen_25_part_10